jgi:hypothetical protein
MRVRLTYNGERRTAVSDQGENTMNTTRKRTKSLVIAIAVLLLGALACGSNTIAPTQFASTSAQGQVANTPSNSNKPLLTNTPKQVDTPRPTNTSKPSTTQEVSEPGLLPGLQPVDVELNLEKNQFTCELVYTPEDNYPDFKWECRSETAQYSMLVEIWSKSLVKVDLIQSSILQFGIPNDKLASDFLGFMATMPYDGAKPQEARTWVENTLPTIFDSGDVREITFAGVQFQLYGIPTARFLEIGRDLPSP